MAPAEKFGPGRKFYARTYAILCKLRFVAIYALFGSKTVFLGQEVHYYMVYIAHLTELILQIWDYAQKGRI